MSRPNLKPLAELADIQYGWTAKASAETDGPRMLRITDIQAGQVDWDAVPRCELPQAKRDGFLLRQGDIVFARIGATTGKSYLIGPEVPADAVFASYLIRVRPREGLRSDYLAHFFQSAGYWAHIRRESRGIGRPAVNGKLLSRLMVPVPSLGEQEAVADFVSTTFLRIDDAVRRFERARAGLAVFRRSVLAAELSSGPEVTLGDVADITSGLTKGRRTKEPVALHPYLRAANLKDGWLDLDEVKHIAATEREVARLALEPGDVLMVEGSGSPHRLGEGWLWEGQVEQCVHQNHVFRARPDRAKILPRYLAWALQGPSAKAHFLSVAKTTSGLNTVNKGQVTALPVRLPGLDAQASAVARLDRALSASAALSGNLDARLAAASQLKSSVLYSAFAGLSGSSGTTGGASERTATTAEHR